MSSRADERTGPEISGELVVCSQLTSCESLAKETPTLVGTWHGRYDVCCHTALPRWLFCSRRQVFFGPYGTILVQSVVAIIEKPETRTRHLEQNQLRKTSETQMPSMRPTYTKKGPSQVRYQMHRWDLRMRTVRGMTADSGNLHMNIGHSIGPVRPSQFQHSASLRHRSLRQRQSCIYRCSWAASSSVSERCPALSPGQESYND